MFYLDYYVIFLPNNFYISCVRTKLKNILFNVLFKLYDNNKLKIKGFIYKKQTYYNILFLFEKNTFEPISIQYE